MCKTPELRRLDHIKNKERDNARSREYYKNHIEKVRETSRQFYELNKEEVKIKRAIYAKEHLEQALARGRKYAHSPHGSLKLRAKEAARRAVGKIDSDTYTELVNEYAGICPYCNKPIKIGTVDHIVPIINGGTNDRYNLVWCCKSCNSSKNSTTLIEWMLYKSTHSLLGGA